MPSCSHANASKREVINSTRLASIIDERSSSTKTFLSPEARSTSAKFSGCYSCYWCLLCIVLDSGLQARFVAFSSNILIFTNFLYSPRRWELDHLMIFGRYRSQIVNPWSSIMTLYVDSPSMMRNFCRRFTPCAYVGRETLSIVLFVSPLKPTSVVDFFTMSLSASPIYCRVLSIIMFAALRCLLIFSLLENFQWEEILPSYHVVVLLHVLYLTRRISRLVRCCLSPQSGTLITPFLVPLVLLENTLLNVSPSLQL